jgi:dolichol-phosphate mannosyltransferase
LNLQGQEELLKSNNTILSVVLPTYNESQNIALLLDSIANVLPSDMSAEIIVVDDNSPDGTADIAHRHSGKICTSKLQIKVLRRQTKLGLSSAILAGMRFASGDIIVVMDGDFSHPPQTIPHMVKELQNPKYDIIVASRYIEGGSIAGWPFKRRLLSKGATKIAQYGLGIQVKDPMSGFFAVRRRVMDGVIFDAIGYKMLLEILVKAKHARVKEVPYVFTNRRAGESKVDSCVMVDYFKAVWRLYRYGKSIRENEKRTSVRFLSKAGRFYTVGASGLLVNYAASFLFSNIMPELWYLYSTIIGIVFSMTSNFFINKIWTFEDRDFHLRKTILQYLLFMAFSSLGALIQLGFVYLLVENYHISYPLALIMAVMVASVGNFLLNKKWTFREKVWS